MKNFLRGILCGLLNGFFGSGGGVIAVPIMEKEGLNAREAHASSVALILALSLVTALFYWGSGGLNFPEAWKYIPYGAAGALLGSLFLRKIQTKWLHRIFGLLIIAASLRMLFL